MRINLVAIIIAFFAKRKGAEFTAVPESTEPVTLTTCDDLKKIYNAAGFVDPKQRAEYCALNCKFLRFQCMTDSEPFDTLAYASSFLERVGNTSELLFNYINATDFEDPAQFSPSTINSWLEVSFQLWTITLSVVPIIMNQWKYYSFWPAVMAITGFIVLTMLGYQPFWIGVHNVLIAFLSLIHSGNSAYLVESIWTLVPMLAPLFLVFFVTHAWHVIIVLCSIIGFVWYIYYCFFRKRVGVNAAIAVVFAQLFVLIEQLRFIRHHFGMANLASAAVETMLNCIIPSGRSSFFVVNAAFNGAAVASKLIDEGGVARTILFFVCFQIACAVAFRACLGAYYLYVLRYKTDLASISCGLIVYLIDLFGPIKCAFRLATNAEAMNSRRLAYAIVGFSMSYFEWCYARELFMLRVLFSFVDIAFVNSRYGRTTHYLEMNIDFCNVAYPQANAPPWMSFQQLRDVSRYVGKITAISSTGAVRGVACALNPGDSPMLYTAQHVVDKAHTVQFMGLSCDADFNPVSSGDDPIVGLKVGSFTDAPDVPMLTAEEGSFVKQLVFINVTEDDEIAYCVVPQFRHKNGVLYASVNLKKGDSGGPVFGVMDDGNLRYCGVVSRGATKSGSGNLISFVYADAVLSHDSSDEENLMQSIGAFNAARRNKFTDDTIDRYEQSDRMMRLMASDDVKGIEFWENKLVHSDFDHRNEESLLNATYPDEVLRDPSLWQDRNPKRDDSDDDDEVDKPHKNRKKGNVKSYNKDRAARKKAILIASHIRTLADNLYSNNDALAIFNAFMDGNKFTVPRRGVIAGPNGKSWLIFDDLPGHDEPPLNDSNTSPYLN